MSTTTICLLFLQHPNTRIVTYVLGCVCVFSVTINARCLPPLHLKMSIWPEHTVGIENKIFGNKIKSHSNWRMRCWTSNQKETKNFLFLYHTLQEQETNNIKSNCCFATNDDNKFHLKYNECQIRHFNTICNNIFTYFVLFSFRWENRQLILRCSLRRHILYISLSVYIHNNHKKQQQNINQKRG